MRIDRIAAAVLAAVAVSAGGAAGANEPPGPRTVVSITFDDARSSQWQAARTVLARHRMRATFYANSGRVAATGHMSWAQLRALQRSGHEIGSHGRDHLKLTLLPLEDRRAQVCGDRARLRAGGLRIESFAFPYARFDRPTQLIVAACGFASARAVGGIAGGARGETLPPRDRWALRTANFVRHETTLRAVQDRIRAAEGAGGRWVPLVLHDVCDRCDPKGYSWPPRRFDALLDWLEARRPQGTVVLPVREALRLRLQAGQ